MARGMKKGGERRPEWVKHASTKAIDSKHLGKPIGFRKSSASALWSDTVIGDEVLTPAHAHEHTHIHTCSEWVREGEGERDRGENPFFRAPVDVRSPLLAWISQPVSLGRYLVGLLLSPMPDQGLSGGAETSRSRVIFDYLSQETMRLCRSASSCRGNSAWEIITWFNVANQGPCYFPMLTFLLINLRRIHVPALRSYLWQPVLRLSQFSHQRKRDPNTGYISDDWINSRPCSDFHFEHYCNDLARFLNNLK